MAIIDYKEKYEKAVQAAMLAKQDTESAVTIGILEEIFPELRESEDERIRKSLYAYFAKFKPNDMWDADFSFGDIVTWLEKQGEQKPADLKTKAGNWYVCDMEVMNENMVTAFHRDEIYYCPKDGYLDVRGALFEVGCLDVFRLATEKEIPQPHPKQEWSEEDEDKMQIIINIIKDSDPDWEELINWLISLRPQNTWKPSDEQIQALEYQVHSTFGGSWQYKASKELLEQLKKL